MKDQASARVRRSQRDYPLGFKLSVVEQVERGEMTYKEAQEQYGIQGRSTVLVWLRKHGKLDWDKPLERMLMKRSCETPVQKIKRLERELAEERVKVQVYQEMADILEQEHGLVLRKKSSAARSGLPKKKV